jgi:multidrug efflux system membrane fusion protein
MKSFFMRTIFFTFAATILLAGCSRKVAPKNSGAVPVLVARAMATSVPVLIDPSPVGHVMAVSTVTVHSQIGGIISEVHFQEGDEVKSNALLFTIDPRPTQAALDVARAALARDAAQLENAKIQFARDQELFAEKVESQDVFDTSRANVDTLAGTAQSDNAAISNAELNLEFTQIRAPIDGKTGALQAYAGNVVKAPDDTLVTINQIHPIYVAFAVPEQLLPQIKKEMAARTLNVSVTFENMNVPPPQGELTFVDNMVDETTGQIQLRGTFPNADGALTPGQFVEVQLTLSDLTNAIVVPSQAVQVGQNGEFIYVVKPDPTNATSQVVEQRAVTIGITYKNVTVVQKGLARGEIVVTDGQLRLAPGVKVTVKK